MSDLPSVDQVGQDAVWELPVDVDDDTEEIIVVSGRFIGVGTSHQDFHRDHNGHYAARRERCGACRWFETRIFKTNVGTYVLHRVGASIVPGEFDLHSVEYAVSPREVIELYTVRPRDGSPSLTKPAARALAQAAHFDSDFREAYDNRAVS